MSDPLTIFDLKARLIEESGVTGILPQHLKFLLSGKVLDDSATQYEVFGTGKASTKQKHKIIAMGMSEAEQQRFNEGQKKVSQGVRVRDDISKEVSWLVALP